MSGPFDRSRAEFCDAVPVDEAVVCRLEAELDCTVDPLTAYAALAAGGRDVDVDGDDVDDEPAEEGTGRDDSYSFLLESAEKTAASDPGSAFRPSGTAGDRHARFSFVGYDPDAVVSVSPGDCRVEVLRETTAAAHVAPGSGDVLDRLRGALPDLARVNFPDTDRQLLDGGLVGFLAYDAVYDLWLDEVGVERPETSLPDAQFVLNTTTLAFDHRADAVSLVCTPVVAAGEDAGAVYDDLAAETERVRGVLADAEPPTTGGFRKVNERADPREHYEEAVRQTKAHVRDGDIYQGVISRTRELDGELDSLGLYEALREVNPSPYMYVLDFGERTVVGASPETLVSVQAGAVRGNPIAGTCPRGSSPVEDRRLAGEMLADDKERAEHTMLVDLARNDVRRVAEPGSVRVPEFMNVLKYSHVQHIESTVTGRLAPDCDAFDAVRASFPAGTLSGAPKVRAMELIHELEEGPRGVYGGGVGYVSWTGDADFAIVIRTATVECGPAFDTVTVQAGAGVVADSDPAAEYEETEKKMGGVLAALARIEDAGDETVGDEDGRDGATERPPEVPR